MRKHPISLAMRYLRGKKTMGVAPFYGRPIYPNAEAALEVLKRNTLQDFGTDVEEWAQWLRRNKWVYYCNSSEVEQKAAEMAKRKAKKRKKEDANKS